MTDGQAEIVVPAEAILTADDQPIAFGVLRRSMPIVDDYPAQFGVSSSVSSSSVSLTFDRFVYNLHISDVAHQTDTHDGDAFADAARTSGQVSVYVVDGVDPRRSSPDALVDAARSGRLVGAVVSAYEVDHVDP